MKLFNYIVLLVNTIDSDLAHIHYAIQQRKEETTYIVKYQPLRINKKNYPV